MVFRLCCLSARGVRDQRASRILDCPWIFFARRTGWLRDVRCSKVDGKTDVTRASII